MSTTTIERPATETAFHYPWCDPTKCYEDNLLDRAELYVLHHSAEIAWEGDPEHGWVQAVRARAVWSETEQPVEIAFGDIGHVSVADSLAYVTWLKGAMWHLEELVATPPADTPCPDWCSADDYDHRWRFMSGLRYLQPCPSEWMRRHRGVVDGRFVREQVEWSNMAGETHLGRKHFVGKA